MKPSSVTITGYDYFTYNNFYETGKKRNSIAHKWHFPEIERAYISSLMEEKQILIL